MREEEKKAIKKIHNIALGRIEGDDTLKEFCSNINTVISYYPIEKKEGYALLWLFCGWIEAPNIGESMPALMLLKQLDGELRRSKGIKNDRFFTHGIITRISFAVLKDELTIFLKHHKIPTDITAFPNTWRKIANRWAKLLTNIPLSFPDPNNPVLKKIYDKKIIAQMKKREGVISINIALFDEGILTNGKQNGNKIPCVVLLTNDATRIVTPL